MALLDINFIGFSFIFKIDLLLYLITPYLSGSSTKYENMIEPNFLY